MRKKRIIYYCNTVELLGGKQKLGSTRKSANKFSTNTQNTRTFSVVLSKTFC